MTKEWKKEVLEVLEAQKTASEIETGFVNYETINGKEYKSINYQRMIYLIGKYCPFDFVQKFRDSIPVKEESNWAWIKIDDAIEYVIIHA